MFQLDARAPVCGADFSPRRASAPLWNLASPDITEALAAYRRIFGEDNRDTLVIESALASLYQEGGRNEEAEPLLLRALDRNRRIR